MGGGPQEARLQPPLRGFEWGIRKARSRARGGFVPENYFLAYSVSFATATVAAASAAGALYGGIFAM